MERPFSASCERNWKPIHDVLNEFVSKERAQVSLFEIGSGTGQHAAYISKEIPSLIWQTSDLEEGLPALRQWTDEVDGLPAPVSFEVGKDKELPKIKIDYVFSSNVIHIMNWKLVKTLFKTLGKSLRSGKLVFFYGPFNYHGDFTSEGNKNLDIWLKENFKGSGVRNFEDISEHMTRNGFILEEDREMPANNRMLIFKKV